MDDRTDSHHVRRLEVVDTGRRRRWTEDEKLRIVQESLSEPRLTSATARRHRISRQLLLNWRKAWREGRLGEEVTATSFVPAVVTPEREVTGERRVPQDDDRIEIVTANGRRIVVGTGIDVAALVRIVRGLEQL
ncbi:MAG: transposase [Dehalococcoidia bacterium]